MRLLFSFASFLICYAVFAQVNLNSGLAAFYPFNGNSLDASGNGNHGTPMNGVQLTFDRFNNPNSAYLFDGINDFITVPNAPSLNPANGLSIALYFKPSRSGLQNLIGKIAQTGGNATQYQVAMDFNLHPGVLFGVNPFASGCSGVPLNSAYVNTAVPVVVNQWHCIVATFDNGVQKIYLNGVLLETLNTGFTTLNQCVNATIQIGKWWDSDPLMYQGVIDDIRIYNRPLNEDEVNFLCVEQSPCDSWLHTPSQPSYVNIGDLDVPGNTITVEATFNSTLNNNGFGDLVAKHQGSSDANYLLRAYRGEITTTNGYFLAATSCPIVPNKIYHVAMVYNGTTLSFYRNGYLMAQVPATGNLIQNNWQTWIGYYQPQALNENFIGYINEVRIWNVARSQSEIIANMNSSLPNPSSQPGLLAYYVFNNLLNKQGNPAWHGTLGGSATINATSSSCNFIRDSCEIIPGAISGVINDYTPVLELDVCKNRITVEDASAFGVGDTVLLIQMKGAAIDSSNTTNFGSITDLNNAGNYEFNIVSAKNGNEIDLLNSLLKQYDIPDGKVQLIRVPYYQTAIINAPLTCLPWDGSKGGVLVLNAEDTVILYSPIDVTGKGFRGGGAINSQLSIWQPVCGTTTYFAPNSASGKREKGEGIAEISNAKRSNRGPLANGGGGGNPSNSGGGGGSNGSRGGQGGDQFEECATGPNNIGGIPGNSLTYDATINKIYLGGGGGAGDANDPLGANSFNPDGGNGGGIVIIKANYLESNSNPIIANGQPGKQCLTNCKEGAGGGGAGGTVLLDINNYITTTNPVIAKGGNGADNLASLGLNHGPGGGGSGGVLFIKDPVLPSSINADLSGGTNGISNNVTQVPWGAQPGNMGISAFNLVLPYSTTVFEPNIDSVRIRDTLTGCNSFSFGGLAYVNSVAISSWQWFFGDGGTANTQNTQHFYNVPGTYPVKLIVTDLNGCKDSIEINITTVCENPIGDIVNDYSAIIYLDVCKNKIVVDDASAFNVGDTVLMIQMQGAIIDSSNTSSFGSITNYRNAGNYEFNYVKTKNLDTLEFVNTILRAYDIPDGKVQLVRVPYFRSVTAVNTLTCLPWNGTVGGVLVVTVQDTMTLNTPINVSGLGFRGGKAINSQLSNWQPFCGTQTYYTANGANGTQEKGEGIAFITAQRRSGRGALANGGGGANLINSGGGGGGNISPGGKGGNQYEECSGPVDIGGIGGKPLTYSSTANKIYMGGGGGAGEANDPVGANSFNPDGGNGGGIVIIKANFFKSNDLPIIANGNAGKTCVSNCTEGMGGGGAGGTVLLDINNFISATNPVIATGGKGADNVPSLGFEHGPGGGGGGGVLFIKNPSLPSFISSTLTGGSNGKSLGATPLDWGATPGTTGANIFNLQLPFASVPFKPNIDSVRIKDSITNCKSFDFKGQGFTNTHPVNSWQWFFGDGGTANVQNTSHTYSSAGTFTVKLVITDINGCKDSILKDVTTIDVFADAGLTDTICSPNSTVLQATQTGGTSISWSPAIYLDDPSSLSPVATPPVTTMFYLTVTAFTGCQEIDSVEVVVRSAATFSIAAPSPICELDSVQLLASGGDLYLWSPSTDLSDVNIPNPWASPSGTTPYSVQITDTVCNNTATLSTMVNVWSLPAIDAQSANDIGCTLGESQLSASGGIAYSWSPAASLNDPNISDPIASPVTTTQYFVTGTDANGCSNKDSVIVNVDMTNLAKFLMPSAFTPNGDGLNDCFGMKYWGQILEVEFNVYNRWGQLVFRSRTPGQCWDGTFMGTKQPPGTFVYWIRAKTNCANDVFRKGQVTLIR